MLTEAEAEKLIAVLDAYMDGECVRIDDAEWDKLNDIRAKLANVK
jgi:hypothetical protein